MHEWTKVLIHPLGLTGFALFLVFGLFAKLKRRDQRRWLFSSAITMAFVTLLGGLGLAYFQIRGDSARAVSTPRPNPPSNRVQQQTNQVQQSTTGPGSPNVQGVQGDVTITVDQSSGKVPGSRAKQNTAKDKQK